MAEKRNARRYDLSLPIIIRVPAEEDSPAHSGKTSNVSTQDVYFTIEHHVSPGTELDITLILPSEVTSGAEVLVRAMGKAVRVEYRPEDNSPRVGVAAAIEPSVIERSRRHTFVLVNKDPLHRGTGDSTHRDIPQESFP